MTEKLLTATESNNTNKQITVMSTDRNKVCVKFEMFNIIMSHSNRFASSKRWKALNISLPRDYVVREHSAMQSVVLF